MYTYPIYIKLACMIRMITLILPLCCLFNPERHELARGIYIIREVYIAMFVIRIIQLTIVFNHSYHTNILNLDQEMSFKDISYLELWRPFCSAEWNHLCNFGRRNHEEQLCKIILNLGQWFRRCCLKTFLI